MGRIHYTYDRNAFTSGHLQLRIPVMVIHEEIVTRIDRVTIENRLVLMVANKGF